jgi:hypothetical protein
LGKHHNTAAFAASQAGASDRWPTRMRFEYFCGFVGGDATWPRVTSSPCWISAAVLAMSPCSRVGWFVRKARFLASSDRPSQSCSTKRTTAETGKRTGSSWMSLRLSRAKRPLPTALVRQGFLNAASVHPLPSQRRGLVAATALSNWVGEKGFAKNPAG